jgi:hypothetical protein
MKSSISFGVNPLPPTVVRPRVETARPYQARNRAISWYSDARSFSDALISTSGVVKLTGLKRHPQGTRGLDRDRVLPYQANRCGWNAFFFDKMSKPAYSARARGSDGHE